MNELLEFFTIDRIIAFIGIAFTGVIAFLIFWIQRRADGKINKIIRQQSEIIKSIQFRRNDRVRWMSGHLVMLLQSLRKNYTDLINRVEEYEADKTEANLRSLSSLSRVSVTMTLQHLIDIADRDIAAAKIT
jgi:sensor histidine kinase YesM